MSSDNGDIFSQGCLIISTFRFWGASKRLAPEQLGDLPKKIVDATRALLRDRSKLAAVNSIKDDAKRFIKSYCLYYPIQGIDFIPKDNIETVDKGLKYRRTLAEEAVEDLIDHLEALKADYRIEYPEYYNEANYPTPEQLMDNFLFSWSFRVFGPPEEGLSILTPEMYNSEVQKFQDEMQEMKDGLVSMVSSEFVTRIDKLREQCLTGNINTGTVESIDKTLLKFDNVWKSFITHDELQKAVSDIREYMKGTKADMLKVDDEFREAVGAKMNDIVSSIKNSPDERLTRKLSL